MIKLGRTGYLIYAIGKISCQFTKVKCRSYFILFIRTNSRWYDDLNIKYKTVKDWNIDDVLRVERAFLHKTKKKQDIKEQIDKFDLIINSNFCIS